MNSTSPALAIPGRELRFHYPGAQSEPHSRDLPWCCKTGPDFLSWAPPAMCSSLLNLFSDWTPHSHLLYLIMESGNLPIQKLTGTLRILVVKFLKIREEEVVMSFSPRKTQCGLLFPDVFPPFPVLHACFGALLWRSALQKEKKTSSSTGNNIAGRKHIEPPVNPIVPMRVFLYTLLGANIWNAKASVW